MIIDIKIPSPGESIHEVEIESWAVENGSIVQKEQKIAEISSDKATIDIMAEDAGVLNITKQEGDIVKVNEVIGSIDTSKKPQNTNKIVKPDNQQSNIEKHDNNSFDKKNILSPAAKKIAAEKNIEIKNINTTNPKGVISKQDIVNSIAYLGPKRGQSTKKMSSLRRKLSERMVYVKNQTAMLSTFNEVDMSQVIDIRNKYKDIFQEKHGIKLGFMSFFVKAVCHSIGIYKNINAMIDGNNVISFDYIDISIAVSTEKGLMVPVLRDAHNMSFKQIELEIKRLSILARDNKISVDDMTGGNFTITNGGVFGSMLSTPLINPPQSSILGMHNIVKRPIVTKDSKIEAKPIMYLALSYDHRLIDGKESVGFLVELKKSIENPIHILMNDDIEKTLGL